ncbi:uncharacterized protein N0V89_011167 [Didymosphaeria variabile]|uniref:Uncharacterized protein n=1 Tax=Didymosphaeria variabile TaxID=1932322 RepID=A0A9W9C789_9PLEO|nr:uncharacterized protein N0V89_011167 [Didymosphaeria variabile]KAJ4347228.1 hypothetical protein N0V89_011167 [Didymosphaeria variabile]
MSEGTMPSDRFKDVMLRVKALFDEASNNESFEFSKEPALAAELRTNPDAKKFTFLRGHAAKGKDQGDNISAKIWMRLKKRDDGDGPGAINLKGVHAELWKRLEELRAEDFGYQSKFSTYSAHKTIEGASNTYHCQPKFEHPELKSKMSQQSSSNNQQDVVMSGVDQTTLPQGFPSDRLKSVIHIADELVEKFDRQIRFDNNPADASDAGKWTEFDKYVTPGIYAIDLVSVWIFMRFKNPDKMAPEVILDFTESRKAAREQVQDLQAEQFAYDEGKWRVIKDLKCILPGSNELHVLQVKIEVKLSEKATRGLKNVQGGDEWPGET